MVNIINESNGEQPLNVTLVSRLNGFGELYIATLFFKDVAHYNGSDIEIPTLEDASYIIQNIKKGISLKVLELVQSGKYEGFFVSKRGKRLIDFANLKGGLKKNGR